MRKILLIANYKGAVGGISGQVEELHKNLNCEATSACIGNSKLVNGNCKYHADIFSTQGSVVRRIVKFIELIFVARGYDVLHIHGCSEWGSLPIIYGVIAGKIWRKRIIITYHGGGAEEFFIRHAHFVRRWLNRADKVIVLNGYLESVFTKYGIPCIVIPNIIELSETQEHSDYQWDAPRFISVRHLRELYNIPCILQAFAMVKERLPKATLTILGDGPQRAELEEWMEKWRDERGELREESRESREESRESREKSGKRKVESVRFVGQVANSEVVRYLAQSDIMLSAPSIDNMPVSLLEAMNAGVLVISSNVGGVPYMIEHGKTGLLFDMKGLEDERISELAKTMMWAVEHHKEAEDMIARAKENVKKYCWQNIREMLLPMYVG